jgi:hypothetical protein
LLPCGGFASGDAAGHGGDRGPAAHGFGGGGVAFAAAGEAAAAGEPGQGAFDAPPAWNDGEAVLAFGFAHDVHHGGEDGAGPADELAGEDAAGEDEPDRTGLVRYAESRVVLAPSRSCTLAASTTTTTSRPTVPVTMNRFLPLIFLPLCRTRHNGKTVKRDELSKETRRQKG